MGNAFKTMWRRGPVLGIVRNLSPEEIDPRAWLTAHNVVFRNGRVCKVRGWRSVWPLGALMLDDVLPNGRVGTAYTGLVTVTGGVPPILISLTSNSLPDGLVLVGDGDRKATLSGTPTVAGNFTFTLTATDTKGSTTTRDYTVIIAPLYVLVLDDILPSGQVGQAYTGTITCTGGVGNIVLEKVGGEESYMLPPGLAFTNNGDATATISGRPTQDGWYDFTVKATDVWGNTVSRLYHMVIAYNWLFLWYAPQDPQNPHIPDVSNSVYPPLATDGVAPITITLDEHSVPTLVPEIITLIDNGNGSMQLNADYLVVGWQGSIEISPWAKTPPSPGCVVYPCTVTAKSNGGLEMMTNGTFTGNADNWTLGAGWQYGTNVVEKYADGTGTLTQPMGNMVLPVVATENGKGVWYTLSYNISDFTVGGESVYATVGGVMLATRTGAGTYVESFQVLINDPVVFHTTSGARCKIDNVSLKRISRTTRYGIEFWYS